MEIDKKVLKKFEEICRANDKIIKTGKDVNPICFVIHKDYKISLIAMKFGNPQEKEIIRNKLLKFIVNQEGVKGYILVLEVTATMMDMTGKEKPKVKHAVMRTLYTPKGNKKNVVFKDGNVLEKAEEIEDWRDEWSLWQNGEHIDGKIIEDYSKFRDNNPDLY